MTAPNFFPNCSPEYAVDARRLVYCTGMTCRSTHSVGGMSPVCLGKTAGEGGGTQTLQQNRLENSQSIHKQQSGGGGGGSRSILKKVADRRLISQRNEAGVCVYMQRRVDAQQSFSSLFALYQS